MDSDEVVIAVVILMVFAIGYIFGAGVEAKRAIPKEEVASHECGLYDPITDVFIWTDTGERRWQNSHE